jgi:integrase
LRDPAGCSAGHFYYVAIRVPVTRESIQTNCRLRKPHYGTADHARIEPRFILYDLRHTYASRALMAGVNLPTLAALLDHTSIQMTMRYVHPAEEHNREAAARLENYKAAEI